MEPTNHPFSKENDLPNLHGYLPGCIIYQYLLGPRQGTEAEHASEEMAKELGLWRRGAERRSSEKKSGRHMPSLAIRTALMEVYIYIYTFYILYIIYII